MYFHSVRRDTDSRLADNHGMHSLPAAGGARPLRILLLTDCYAPTVNGVVRSVIDLRDGLIADGHDVRVLTFGESHRSTFDGEVYRLASISASAVYPHARLGRPTYPKVRRHIDAWGPDVVHSHTEFPAFAWARGFARRLGVAHVHTYHTLYEDYTHYFCPSRRLGRSMVRAWTRTVLNRPDRVIAPTAKVAAVIGGYGVATPVDVIGTGVDLDTFRPVADAGEAPAAAPQPRAAARRDALALDAGLTPGIPVVLTVGRIAAEKNLGETLELLRHITDVPWQWLIVGDGPDAPALRQLITRHGLESRVHMIGAVPADEVHVFYGIGDVFATSSRSETQGLTCLEALSSGLPVLCPDDDAFRGVVLDGVNGHRYTGPADFRATMETLLSDATTRRAWSASARASARHFGRGRFASEVTATYRMASDLR